MGNYKLSIFSEIDIAEMYEFGIVTFGILKAQNYFSEMEAVFQLLSETSDL